MTSGTKKFEKKEEKNPSPLPPKEDCFHEKKKSQKITLF